MSDEIPRPQDPKKDDRWSLIAEDLKARPVPGWANAFAFIEQFALTVCGGMVWRPLHDPTNKAHDIDVIARDQVSLRTAIASIPVYDGEGNAKLSKTRFGGDRVAWTKPSPGSLDIWVVPPDLLMTFVAQLVPGKRTLWTPSGIVLDLDPGVVPRADFIEPYNVTLDV